MTRKTLTTEVQQIFGDRLVMSTEELESTLRNIPDRSLTSNREVLGQ